MGHWRNPAMVTHLLSQPLPHHLLEHGELLLKRKNLTLSQGSLGLLEVQPVGNGLSVQCTHVLLAGLRIRIRSDPVFLHGSGSGFQISLDPDPVSAQILKYKKNAERSLKVIYQKKTLNL